MTNRGLIRDGDEKTMVADNWRQDLVELYPRIFLRKYRGVPYSPGFPSTCKDGWHDLVAKLVERESVAAEGYSILFTEIREAHGRLTVHWKAEAEVPRRAEQTIEEAIALARARAACSC